MLPEIQGFFDPVTSTVSYVVYEACASECAIIDPVLDYDAAAGRISTASADNIAAFVQAQGLKVQWLLETHAHADHLSASAYLKRKLGGQIGIGAAITQVQGVFRDIYNLEPGVQTGRPAVRPAVRTGRVIPHRATTGTGTACAGTHPGRYGLSG